MKDIINIELINNFSDEKKHHNHLRKIMWTKGMYCPHFRGTIRYINLVMVLLINVVIVERSLV